MSKRARLRRRGLYNALCREARERHRWVLIEREGEKLLDYLMGYHYVPPNMPPYDLPLIGVRTVQFVREGGTTPVPGPRTP